MTIHKEGIVSLSIALMFGIIVNLAAHFYFIDQTAWKIGIFIFTLVVFLLILQFFRKPYISTPQDDSLIYCPADGKIVVIEEVFEPEYFKEVRLQISIFMSPFNVHSNKCPISGTVKYVRYHPGLFLVAWHPKSSTDNERNTVVIGNEKKGIEVLSRQIAGFMARRICSYAQVGDAVKQGQEFGFIKFGSRVDVFLPVGTAVNVQLGQSVKAGKTVLAKI